MPLYKPDIYTTMFNATASKTVANTSTDTSLVPTGAGSLIVPAGWFTPGKSLRIVAGGKYSAVTLPGSLTVAVALGGTNLVSSTASGLLSLAVDQDWSLRTTLHCRTAGTSGSVVLTGTFEYQVMGDARSFRGLNTSTPAVIDTTQPLSLDVMVKWATALGGNSFTTVGFTVEGIQPAI
jgi:hypothetical protein